MDKQIQTGADIIKKVQKKGTDLKNQIKTLFNEKKTWFFVCINKDTAPVCIYYIEENWKYLKI